MPARRVVQVGPTAGHPGAEVRADRPEHGDDAAGHVLAAVRPDALHDRRRRPLFRTAKRIPARPTRCRRPPVAPYRHVLPATWATSGRPSELRLRAHDHRPAGEALADVVVRLAGRGGCRCPCGRNAPNDWPAEPREPGSRPAAASSPRSTAPASPAPNDRSAVVSAKTRRPRSTPWSRSAADERLLQRARQVAWRDAAARGRRARRAALASRRPARGGEDRREVVGGVTARGSEARRCLRRRPRRRDRAPIAASSVAQVLGDGEREPLDLLGRARELRRAGPRAGWRCPVGHVSRWHWRAMSQPIATSIAVPNPNSSAPRSAATRTSRPVWRPPSVRSDDAIAQAVAKEDLVDLGQPELPRRPGVLDRR